MPFYNKCFYFISNVYHFLNICYELRDNKSIQKHHKKFQNKLMAIKHVKYMQKKDSKSERKK